MKVAIVHDYLREYGGAERVVEVLHEIFPDAPLYTAYHNPKSLGIHASRFEGWDIRTSFLQRLPFGNKLITPLRIIAPWVFERFDLSEYDVVISSCAIYFAKAIKVKKGALHISYIHTPPRYLYGYTTSFNYKKHWWTRVLGEVLNHFLRLMDYQTSQRPDILVANSENVRRRIKKFYRRDSVVIYPPVEISTPPSNPQPPSAKRYFLVLNRLVRGKGTEMVVEACCRLGLELKVIGSGPEESRLQESRIKNQAGRVEFLGAVNEEEKYKLLRGAKALIVASEDEDFGITAVEAQGCGVPVIAMSEGGYLETIVEGKTGEFFDCGKGGGYMNEETIQNLCQVLKNFDYKKYKQKDLEENARKFSKQNFIRKIRQITDKR